LSGTAGGRRLFGEGPLSRITAFVYTLLAVEGLLVLVLAPSLVVLTFLARDVSNLPLVALAAVPAGPALVAALTALRRPRDLGDLRPAAGFVHGLRTGTGPVLRLWVPALGLLTILGINLTHLDAAGVPRAWAVPMVGLLVVTVVWALQAVVIVAVFAFRTRDVARLAGYAVLRSPVSAWGVLALLVVAAAVVVQASEVALLLLGSVFSLLLLATCRPMTEMIGREFVAEEPPGQ